MKICARGLAVLGAVLFGLSVAQAGSALSGEEVKALFANKTFSGVNEGSLREYRAYGAPDGTLTLHYDDGKKVTTKWRVDDQGRHCVVIQGNERCAQVFAAGGGVYRKIANGVLTHTLRNFADGNKL